MRFIQVEITNRCNLNCPYCSRHINPPALRDLSESEFNHILEQLYPYRKNLLCLCGLGEPFLNPYFPEMLHNSLLSQFNPKLITNGVLLTPKNIDLLVETDVFNQIQVSLQTTIPEVYEKLQVGGNYSTVVTNLKKLIEHKPPRAKIIVQYLKTRLNPNESVNDFRKLLGSDSSNKDVMVKTHIVGPVGGMAQQYSYNYLVSKRKHLTACRGEFGHDIIINAYGDLLGCCWDNTRLQKYGNIFKETLKEAREGVKLVQMRKQLSNNVFTYMPLCKTCYEVMK